MVGVFELEAAVGTLLLKPSYLKTYVPNLDELVAADFFNITAKNTLRNFIISSNVVKFADKSFCFFVYF